MSVNAKVTPLHPTAADHALATAHEWLMRFAELTDDEDRQLRAYGLGIELNKLRRPELVAQLDAERLQRARGG